MDSELPPLIRALRDPGPYPDPAPQVELVQTHISWVLLAGDFAYKIKKPLKLPFLDFSTLALRRQYCEDELRLNRRFAPDIYLAVVPICGTAQAPRMGGAGDVIEYAVKMRRFDEAGRLDRVCARGELTPTHMSTLADTLVAFHQSAAVAPAGSRFGSPPEILAPALDNFRDLSGLLPQAEAQQRLAILRGWTEAQYRELAPLMAQRKATGYVRECHGDLHLANLVLVEPDVRLFDCLEFNEDLRWIDVANEVAFTYVDLLDHGQPGLAGWFVDEVLSRSGDYGAALLLRFYAVYRAMVRAKVAAIRAGQTGSDGGEVLVCMAQAECLVAPPAPRLVITHGLAGCGKTMASTWLLQHDAHARTLRLRSDVERKRLYGVAPTQRSGSGSNAGIYAPDAHQRTYARLRALAGPLLQAGWSVIVDAAFLKRKERASFRSLAEDCGAAFAILAPEAPPEILRQRIQARQAMGRDASEATLEVLEQQLGRIEPLDAAERGQRLQAAFV